MPHAYNCSYSSTGRLACDCGKGQTPGYNLEREKLLAMKPVEAIEALMGERNDWKAACQRHVEDRRQTDAENEAQVAALKTALVTAQACGGTK